MKKMRFHKSMLLVMGSSLVVSGCVVRERVVYRNPPPPAYQPAVEGEVVVSGAPPAPLQETISVSPDPAFVWIGGVWVWGGGGWRWEAGRWAGRPHPGAVWVANRYEFRGGRHVFVRGGWR